jgi:transposase
MGQAFTPTPSSASWSTLSHCTARPSGCAALGPQWHEVRLCDLFHRSAELLRPLANRIVERITESAYINADETSLKIQNKGGCRRGFVWTFIAENLIAFVFSASRSGETPKRLLDGTSGYLQVDERVQPGLHP